MYHQVLIGIFYSQIVESSSLVSVLFREVFSHPYISFFHLLVNGFSVIYIYVTGSEIRYIVAHNMIFLYKRYCSKTRNIFYSLKKNYFFVEVSTTLCLHSRQI